ncbi:MAG: aldehyde ferredoxin oxidoreductase family protein [Candidatus Bathyarchaeia archaeon]
MYGWQGKILHINLSRGKIWTEGLDEQLCELFLGGRGINAKLLWNLITKSGIDPLGPENVLIFGTGTLTGTTAPSSGRTTVTCKSPMTNLFLKTNMGGHWGAELKFAGYDHLVLHGKAEKPVYIALQDENVEIRDAKHVWGLDVRETTEALTDELNDKEAKIACIGPAGENLVRFAAVMNSVYHAAGRGGAGAVMGSKNVKAIAVRGTKSIELWKPDEFRELTLAVRMNVAKDSGAQTLYQYGTANSFELDNELHRLPNRNFIYDNLPDPKPLSGQNLVEKEYLLRRVGCFSCTISCHRFVEAKSGPYDGAYTGGPEFETFEALGAQPFVIDTDAIIKASELCNIYGIDTISTGAVISWAMESFERGVLTREDTDGIELKFGNAEAMIETIHRIAFRRGNLGKLLADGAKRAAEKVGKESWKWAVCNSKGLEQSNVDTRSAKAYALAFAVNPRGPDHLHTETIAEFGASPEAVALIEKITGDKKWAQPHYVEYRPEIVRWHEDCYAVTDSLGFCAFATTAAYAVNPENMAQMFHLATGIPMDEKTIMTAGRRIVTLEKCFNIREGADRKLDDLPWRLMNEPVLSGPYKGLTNSKQELDAMLNRYYELHEWDPETSWPYRETLEKLGLLSVAQQLERNGIILPKKKG